MFQWRGLFFRWGASFLSEGGGAPWRASVLVVGESFEKNRKIGGEGRPLSFA